MGSGADADSGRGLARPQDRAVCNAHKRPENAASHGLGERQSVTYSFHSLYRST